MRLQHVAGDGLWKWYGIEKGRPLTEDEIEFVVELVMGWIGGMVGRSDFYTGKCVFCHLPGFILMWIDFYLSCWV